jgi:hypothetical protein
MSWTTSETIYVGMSDFSAFRVFIGKLTFLKMKVSCFFIDPFGKA